MWHCWTFPGPQLGNPAQSLMQIPHLIYVKGLVSWSCLGGRIKKWLKARLLWLCCVRVTKHCLCILRQVTSQQSQQAFHFSPVQQGKVYPRLTGLLWRLNNHAKHWTMPSIQEVFIKYPLLHSGGKTGQNIKSQTFLRDVESPWRPPCELWCQKWTQHEWWLLSIKNWIARGVGPGLRFRRTQTSADTWW
jgi:hypothetical protein